MKKTKAQLIDELSITNIKIFYLVDKVQKNEHTVEDAKKIQDLNSYRSQLVNSLNEEFGDKKDIKV
ncbi:MAG: hypothetical protein WC479_02970 [Candidatus Izemoplasmatales bacterium]